MIDGIGPMPLKGIIDLSEKQIIVLANADNVEMIRPFWKPAPIYSLLRLTSIQEDQEAVICQGHGIHFIKVERWSADGIAEAINNLQIFPLAACAILSAGKFRPSRNDVVWQALKKCQRPITIYPIQVS